MINNGTKMNSTRTKNKSDNSEPVVYIPVIDPECGGGVKTVMEFTAKTFSENGYFPTIMYNSVDWKKGRTLKDIILGRFSAPVYERSENQRKTVEIGRVLPESETLGYILNINEWNDRLNEDSSILGVGGTCLPCFPAAFQGYTFDCWIGTTLVDERRYQIQRWPRHRRYRYQIERPLLRILERYVLKSADNIYVQSEHTEKMIHEGYSIGRKKIRKIPFPIDTEKYCPGNKTNLTKKIIFIGRLNDPRKRVDILLKGFAELLKECPDAQLHLVGGEPNPELITLINSLNLESSLELHGRVENILPFLRQASVFVLPSDQEGLGIAGLEAMSTGVPVVSTRCGGPEDYIEDGKNGYLVPRRDPIALASAIEKLLKSQALHQQMSSQARKTVENKYQEDKVKSQLLEAIN